MSELADDRQAVVVHESDVPASALEGGAGWVRICVGPDSGARHVTQAVARFAPGGASRIETKPNEEVLYVASGGGEAAIGSERFLLRPGLGVLVPPGCAGEIRNPGPEELRLVAVVSPPLGASVAGGGPTEPVPPAAVHQDDERPLPAGDDRFFKLMIDPRFGARNMTQFVGSIERSRAPFHTHTYEEVIYILSGRGLVHAHGWSVPVREGSSVFLPPGVPHCLENASAGVLRLLGVFSPAGSPADKAEE